MSLQSITLALPDSVMHRARQAAQTLHLPLEDMLANVLAAALPEVVDAPPEVQAELAQMTWLNDTNLWQLAHSEMPDEQQEKLRHLSGLQGERSLNEGERTEIETLRRAYGITTLRKARAYALLSLRSGRPLLAEV